MDSESYPSILQLKTPFFGSLFSDSSLHFELSATLLYSHNFLLTLWQIPLFEICVYVYDSSTTNWIDYNHWFMTHSHPWSLHGRSLFFLNYFLLKDNCFAEFCCFLSNLKMNQP